MSNYSSTVTWTYFAIYALIFLITSIYCAIEVNNQNKEHNINNPTTTRNTVNTDNEEAKYEDDQTIHAIQIASGEGNGHQNNSTAINDKPKKGKKKCIKLLTQWAKLVWKKKKIYLALLPHFFDQATDIGVILVYHEYNQSNQDIGINTHYLFWVSIAILIFHRFISSLAIYLLTKSTLDAILQIFDVLTVKCVWISYILEMDQPSNPQRYLQIFEAIFEVKHF